MTLEVLNIPPQQNNTQNKIYPKRKTAKDFQPQQTLTNTIKVSPLLLFTIATAGNNINAQSPEFQSDSIAFIDSIATSDSIVSTPKDTINFYEAKKETDDKKIHLPLRLPRYLTNKTIQYKKRVEIEGKSYTMVFSDTTKPDRNDTNVVNSIYFVPDDYVYLEDPINGVLLTSPPKMQKFVYHETPNNSHFCSVITTEKYIDKETKEIKYEAKEMLLPLDTAIELVKLVSGQTPFQPTQHLYNDFIAVTK